MKKVYMYDEILEIIKKYGMPQDWNDDGKYGPERYKAFLKCMTHDKAKKR